MKKISTTLWTQICKLPGIRYKRLDKISTEMIELTGSINFTQNYIDEKIENVQQKIVNLEKNINKVENKLLDPEKVSSELVELEDRSQINKPRVKSGSWNSWNLGIIHGKSRKYHSG